MIGGSSLVISEGKARVIPCNPSLHSYATIVPYVGSTVVQGNVISNGCVPAPAALCCAWCVRHSQLTASRPAIYGVQLI